MSLSLSFSQQLWGCSTHQQLHWSLSHFWSSLGMSMALLPLRWGALKSRRVYLGGPLFLGACMHQTLLSIILDLFLFFFFLGQLFFICFFPPLLTTVRSQSSSRAAKNGFSITSLPSTGLMTTRRVPRTTTRPRVRVVSLPSSSATASSTSSKTRFMRAS